jgi:hypothetical protein
MARMSEEKKSVLWELFEDINGVMLMPGGLLDGMSGQLLRCVDTFRRAAGRLQIAGSDGLMFPGKWRMEGQRIRKVIIRRHWKGVSSCIGGVDGVGMGMEWPSIAIS